LCSGSVDGKIRFWDIRKAKPCLYEYYHDKTANVNGLVFSSEGSSLVSTATDNRLKMWCAFSGTERAITFGPHFQNQMTKTVKMAVTPMETGNPSFMFYPSDTGDILVYSLRNGNLISRLKGHLVLELIQGPVAGIALDSDLVSCGTRDGVLRWVPLMNQQSVRQVDDWTGLD
jgi:DNA excision repair protein ERCC-8